MNIAAAIEQLRIEKPELYRTVVNQGVMQERVRVLAHLNVAGMYYSLPEAVEAVAAGMPATLVTGEVIPYTLLHDHYAFIEDERDELEAASGYL